MPVQEYTIPAPPKLSPDFRIKLPPKYRVLARIARTIGEGLDYVDRATFANVVEAGTREKLKQCLGHALDCLFKRKLHEARNTLLVSANLLSRNFNEPFPVRRPPGVRPDRLGRIKLAFYNKRNGADLWDTVVLERDLLIHGQHIVVTATGSAAVRGLAEKTRVRVLRAGLSMLADMADALNADKVFEEDLLAAFEERSVLQLHYMKGLSDFHKRPLHPSWITKLWKDQTPPQDHISNDHGHSKLLDMLQQAEGLVRVHLAEEKVDQAYWAMEKYNQVIKLYRDFVCYLDHAQMLELAREAQAELAAEIQRANQVHNNLESRPLWDTMGSCVTGIGSALANAWNASMERWYGAYKWVALGTCVVVTALTYLAAIMAAAAAIPTGAGAAAIAAAIGSFILNVIEAIASAIWCFLKAMVGSRGSWGVAYAVGECIYDAA